MKNYKIVKVNNKEYILFYNFEELILILEVTEYSNIKFKRISKFYQKLKNKWITRIFKLMPKNRDEARDDIKFIISTVIAIIMLFTAIKANTPDKDITINNNIYKIEQQNISTDIKK